MEWAELGLKTFLPVISEAMLPNTDVTLSPKRPDVADQAHRGGGAALLVAPLAASKKYVDTIVNDIVFLGEFGAVHGEEGARGVVQHAEQVDLALGGMGCGWQTRSGGR